MIQTRAFSSTKPSAHCMALATCKGGKGFGSGGRGEATGDEANNNNIILAHRLNGSQQQQRSVCCPDPHCGADIKSLNFPHSSYDLRFLETMLMIS